MSEMSDEEREQNVRRVYGSGGHLAVTPTPPEFQSLLRLLDAERAKVARVEALVEWLEDADRKCGGIDLPAATTAVRFRAAFNQEPADA